MVYCVSPELYPNSTPQFIEECIYKDENDFEWRICRVENGLFVRYFGDTYFMDSVFYCEVPNKSELVKIKNTGCFFFQDTSFELFCEIREILNDEFTGDIWDTFKSFIETRLACSLDLLESEVC